MGLGSRHLIIKSLNSFEILFEEFWANSVSNIMLKLKVNNLLRFICSINKSLSNLFLIPMNISIQISPTKKISYLISSSLLLLLLSLSKISAILFLLKSNFCMAFSKFPILAFPSWVKSILFILIFLFTIFN